MNIWPPGCGDQGCVSHLAGNPATCACPRYWDSGGTHIIKMNPACPEHVVESHPGTERGRATMEHTNRALGYWRDV
jgi:hypothetical protein